MSWLRLVPRKEYSGGGGAADGGGLAEPHVIGARGDESADSGVEGALVVVAATTRKLAQLADRLSRWGDAAMSLGGARERRAATSSGRLPGVKAAVKSLVTRWFRKRTPQALLPDAATSRRLFRWAASPASRASFDREQPRARARRAARSRVRLARRMPRRGQDYVDMGAKALREAPPPKAPILGEA